MTTAFLEHVNLTVSDPEHTADWLCKIFDWKIRWRGPSVYNAITVHVGTDAQYLALYSQGKSPEVLKPNYELGKSLNHIALLVDDLAATKTRVEAAGFTVVSEQTYEPGSRFYFYDQDGIEYEIVSYA